MIQVMIHKWVLEMGVNRLLFPKHHRPKLVRSKEATNVVLFDLVREELAELQQEYVLVLAPDLEVGLQRHLKHQLLIANVVIVVVVLVRVRAEVKGQKLDLLP